MKDARIYQMILASQSPRRKELLNWLGVPFLIRPADIDESVLKAEEHRPEEFVRRLALAKAQACLKLSPTKPIPFVIASDTTVSLKDKILNKPSNRDEAREMLQTLSGQVHRVFTAIAFKTLERQEVFSHCTEVEFSVIEPDVLDPYLDSGDSLDKAGAYGIQGMGLTFVKSVRGSYSNVVGFPLVECLENLRQFMVQEGYERHKWREAFR
jgi:septum formation protein